MLSSSSIMSILVTVAVALFVVLFPLADLAICKRLGISPHLGDDGTSTRTRWLLRTRQFLLYVIFAAYLAIMAYIVFFSREAAEEYLVHIAPFEDLNSSVAIDFGIFGLIKAIFTEGPIEAFKHVQVLSIDNIVQVYLNVMLFVPFGYLLPYVFRWYRAKVRGRIVSTCFLTSLFIENVQLATKLGLYDLDDLTTNTIGGYLGELLFVAFAYAVTKPDWRRKFASYVRWRLRARSSTLYPFIRSIDLSRTTLKGTYEEAVYEFYVRKLGFHLIGQTVPVDASDTTLLLEMGQSQVEICCSNQDEELGEQYLNLTARDLVKVRKRLERHGIEVGPISDDTFPGMRQLSFYGPDNVRISILESYVS